MIAWVLSLMILLQPAAPWLETYETTAQGIIEGAKAAPLYSGQLSVERTVVLDVSIAWFESRFNTHAIGDKGAAHGLYQVHAPEAATVKQQTIEANAMVRQSFKACSRRDVIEWLGWYAAGGNDCNRGLQASRHRMLKAIWLFKNHPPE